MKSYQEEGFDSQEEQLFYYWLKEAEEIGFVSDIMFHPRTYLLTAPVKIPVLTPLKTKARQEEMHLLGKWEYTPDFQFFVSSEWQDQRELKCLSPYLPCNQTLRAHLFQGYCMVDVKGLAFSVRSGGHDFSRKQKMMWEKYQIYVNRVVGTPPGFFKKVWIPEAAFSLLKRSGTKKEAAFRSCPTREQYLRARKGIDSE